MLQLPVDPLLRATRLGKGLELVNWAWAAGAGPVDAPYLRSSSITPSARLTDWPRRAPATTAIPASWCYHPLLEIASRHRSTCRCASCAMAGPPPPAAGSPLRHAGCTVGWVRYAGANGRLTLRSDSGFYTHGVVSVCRKMDVRFSITIRQHKSLRNLIEAVSRCRLVCWSPTGWDGAADRWRRPPTPPSGLSPAPHRSGSSSFG